ncbi:hypothetical protein Tco_0442262 [Tanacetum coccineum]
MIQTSLWKNTSDSKKKKLEDNVEHSIGKLPGMDKSKNHKKRVKIEQARTRELEEYKIQKQSQESQASVKSSQSMVNKSQQSPSSFYNIHKG